MKKRMTFLGLLVALILTVSAVNSVSFTYKAKTPLDVSVTNLQLLDVKLASANDTDNKAKRVSFTINRNLGGNPFDLFNPTKDKVVYTVASGGTRELSSIKYRLVDTVATLVFSFVGDTGAENIAYAVGDTITIKAGFSFSNWNGGDLGIKFLADQTVTYTAKGWTGTFIDSSLSAPIISKGLLGVSGNALIFDFGVSGTGAENNGVVDKTTGWYENASFAPAKLVYENTDKFVDYKRNGSEYIRTRFLFADGKFGVDLGAPGTADDPQKGDAIIFKKGLVILSITNINSMVGYPENDNNYRPYIVLNEEMSFYFDGTNWTDVVLVKSVEFTNTAEEKATLRVGTILQLKWETDADAKEPFPEFTSNAENIATVTASGLVTGLSVGEVKITAKFLNISKEITLNVGAEDTKESIVVGVSNGSERDGKKFLVAYKDVDLVKSEVAKKITGQFKYTSGALGETFTVTADMIDFETFNNKVEGETKITVKNGNIKGEVSVYVYDVKTINAVEPNKIVSYGDAINLHFEQQIDGNEAVDVRTLDHRGENPYGILANMVEFREPTHAKTDTAYEFYSLGHASNKQMLLYFGNVNGSKMGEERVGCVLTLKENFRFYRFVDNYWIASYKLATPVSYVWNGSAWETFVADATDLTLGETPTNLPLNAEYIIKYNLLPENSYVTPTITSDDSAIASVENGKIIGKAIGETIIKVTVGANTKTFNVKVVESNPTSFVLANDRTYNVAKNAKFDISKISAKLDFGNGFLGESFKLTEDNTKYELDTQKVGKQNLNVEITHTEYGKTVKANVTIKIEVHDLIEQVPNSLWDAHDIDWAGGIIMILFNNTFPNASNVFPADLSDAEAETIINHIFYYRNGASLTINNPGFLKDMLAFGPQIDGVTIKDYIEGDQIKLTKGLKFYKYFGDLDANNVPINKENGDFVLIGELKYDVLFTYMASGKFWMSIEYADAKVIEEAVTIGLNTKHSSNVEILPIYATNGEWTFKVANEEIASVNVNGLITAKKIGTTLVTAVLGGGTAGEKTVTFTINVVDVISGIEFTSQNLKLNKGSELTISKLEELGVKAKFKYASGKVEGDVDLKNAKISGYDSDKLGAQTVVIRVSVDGKSVTGELKIEVVEEGKNGCKGCVAGTLGGTSGGTFGGTTSILFTALMILGCVILLKRKNSNKI